MKEMSNKYNPQEIEANLYKNWEENGYFKPLMDPNKESFCVMMPPPNITGQLHMGHALDQTIQDVYVRYNRMKGKDTLWLPGTDHASIATEVKVVNKIFEETGKTKDMLTREEFMKEAWAWKEKYQNRIIEQVKKLGSSCDWSRQRFTLDDQLSEVVTNVFVSLYEKGLIYKGVRIVNWCPSCKTSISDTEVEYEEDEGKLWHIKYKIEDEDSYVVVATTRPETIFGDTAVAVHPEDERYKNIIGKNVILPLLNKKIPVVADEYVEKDFGTGVVKITPAHDPNDFEVGLRHNLPVISVMNEDATMNELAIGVEGLDRYEARKIVLETLENQGLLVKTEKHIHNVGTCYRCHSVIEPYASKQWFVKMKELAKPAIEVVRNKEVKFIPERFDKQYFHWMENIRDWCVSRQLWWGHRIPAFYCDDCNETIVTREKEVVCPKCGKKMYQDEDVLDTWFSSALWPFSTLGWPNETEDYKKFYPTSMLVTGYDILTFWVSKMIFTALEFTGKSPFEHVFIHGLVRAADGRKMSKSLGNGIDPLEVIDNYGTDALRFSLVQNISAGNDIRFKEEKVEASRNFANKLWNAARFANMYISKLDREVYNKIDITKLSIEDKWILNKTTKLAEEVTNNIDSFDIGIAIQKIYDFIWSDICDTYIEMIKTRLYDENCETYEQAIWTLNEVLKIALKLLHPFMPFITEEIYLNLIHEDKSIMISEWPSVNYDYKEEYKVVEEIIDATKQIRNIRAESNIPNSKKTNAVIVDKTNLLVSGKHIIEKLAFVNNIVFKNTVEDANLTGIHEEDFSVFIDFSEAINKEEEIEKLNKEIKNAKAELARAEGMLKNEKFVAKAPEKLIAAEKEKQIKYSELITKLEERLKKLEQ